MPEMPCTCHVDFVVGEQGTQFELGETSASLYWFQVGWYEIMQAAPCGRACNE